MKKLYTVPRYRKTRCNECGTWDFAPVCPLCKAPRSIFGLLKAVAEQSTVVTNVRPLKPRLKARTA